MEQKGKEKGCSREQEGEKKKKREKENRRCLKKREFICTGGN